MDRIGSIFGLLLENNGPRGPYEDIIKMDLQNTDPKLERLSTRIFLKNTESTCSDHRDRVRQRRWSSTVTGFGSPRSAVRVQQSGFDSLTSAVRVR